MRLKFSLNPFVLIIMTCLHIMCCYKRHLIMSQVTHMQERDLDSSSLNIYGGINDKHNGLFNLLKKNLVSLKLHKSSI